MVENFTLESEELSLNMGLQYAHSMFILKHQLGIRHMNIRELSSRTNQVCAFLGFLL